MLFSQAHKLILASATDYFDAMFSCPLRESSQSEVELPSLDGIALRRLLDFVYLGEVLSFLSFIFCLVYCIDFSSLCAGGSNGK